MKKIFFLCLALIVGACAYHNPLENFRWEPRPVSPYLMPSWHHIQAYGQPIRIYIEGDVDSADEHGNPTQNPTPKTDFWRKVAAGDPGQNLAYIGQPCQFVQMGCSAKDWGSARFSKQAVNGVVQAVLALMRKAGTNQAVLIGYAGGAQLAGLVAMEYPDKISQVITVAGIWDYQEWAKYNQIEDFHDSADLTQWRKKRNKLNQLHFVGEKDTVVPPELAKTWANDVVVVKGATHTKGYDKILSQVYGGK